MNHKTKIAAVKASLKQDERTTLNIITDKLSDDDIDYLTSKIL